MLLADVFAAEVGRPPQGVWTAPGRINLIGEHTDYNDGFVLPFALSQGVRVAGARRPDRTITLRSRQQPGPPVIVDLDTLRPGQARGWAAYGAGVAWALQAIGCRLDGVDLLIDGDIPVGAGLSSSAALECAIGSALDGLGGFALSATELARVARAAESDFVGVPCGLMDQLVSMTAVAHHATFLDMRSLVGEPVPFRPAAAGLTLLVLNTNARRDLAQSAYAERRRACEEAARLMKVASLREVTMDDLDAALARLHGDVLVRRVRHVVTENARVLAAFDSLGTGNPAGLGPLLTASHQSLRNDFEVSSPQLDTAVDAAMSAGALGARLTGAGFGGCAIALVPAADADGVVAAVTAAFDLRGFPPPSCFVAEPSAGARRVS